MSEEFVSQHIKEMEELCHLLIGYAGEARREGILSLKGLPKDHELLKVVIEHLCSPNLSTFPDMNRDQCIMKGMLLIMEGKSEEEVRKELRHYVMTAPRSARSQLRHQAARE